MLSCLKLICVLEAAALAASNEISVVFPTLSKESYKGVTSSDGLLYSVDLQSLIDH